MPRAFAAQKKRQVGVNSCATMQRENWSFMREAEILIWWLFLLRINLNSQRLCAVAVSVRFEDSLYIS